MTTLQDVDIPLVNIIIEALSDAIQDAFGIVRVAFADSIGQFLVAIYTPFYCIGDFVISFLQVVFGLMEMIFGFLPEPLWLTALALFFLAILTFIILFVRGMIR